MNANANKKFQVGDLATMVIGSDRVAGRIIECKGETRVLWQADRVELVNGPESGRDDALRVSPGGFVAHVSGKQKYNCYPDPNGRTEWFSRREMRGGELRYVVVYGDKHCGVSLIEGSHHHYDYNF